MPALIEIVNRCSNLINERKNSTKDLNYLQLDSLKYWQHHQANFDEICVEFFDLNPFETFNEYIYHFIMNFVIAWINGVDSMKEGLDWNATQMKKKTNDLLRS